MSKLREIKCVGCEGGIPALTKEEMQELMPEVSLWKLDDSHKFLWRQFKFNNFYETIAFVNAIAWIANQEGHHPDLMVGYNYCHIKFTTHAVDGLTQNDFICAAKIDALENV